jgi:hypothetical protein
MNEYAPIPEAPARPVRTHRFLDRHTNAGFLLLTLWGYLVAQLVGVVAALPFSIPAALSGGLDEELLNTVAGFACAVGGFLALLIHKRWFRPEFRGCLRGALCLADDRLRLFEGGVYRFLHLFSCHL